MDWKTNVLRYALLQLFKPFGKITFIEVMIHRIGPKKGLSRGFGFLEYEKKEVDAFYMCNMLLSTLILHDSKH
jgi:hypothetical protein